MKLTRKRSTYSLLLITVMIAALLSACGKDEAKSTSAADSNDTSAQSSDANSDPISIKIADIISNPVFRIAKTQGFFDKYGIDAQIVTFATPAEGINSLFIKQADVAFGADFPVLNAVSKGDYSVIAATGTNTDIAAAQWKLFVGPDIQSAADLKGKKLSTLRGTFLPYLWDEYLKENGVAAADTKQIGQGGYDEAYVALKKGEIDATWVVGSAMVEKFTAIEGVHELTDMSKTSVRIGGGIIAPNSLVKEHPTAVANFLRAIDEATKFITDNPEKTADILFEEVKQPKESTLRDLPTNNWEIGFKQESFDSLSSQKKYMIEAGIIKDDFDLASKISLDPIKQAAPDRVTYGK
ncbi:NitT/TauT family transport system substrate-binding protein [Paenibacillus cellulosilyticus]|uniref:NitT/TauT family transport system substrate-binding protein n=1 Tax=Paenibacillus cellulosilyticus TaxID=375489 RepID=A0A2V2YY30_9BACL|nr:ABC transporter substrate-binding protein [Paenibacillus cellulosilyticus]PWW07168.1 NitT/TauT family transport system substrate-binding protein [Paenibacillus cellulosilyticus]QKS44628.1 ABC transporter substrate-binding protein [Paenibacillus cellulosilyticus]